MELRAGVRGKGAGYVWAKEISHARHSLGCRHGCFFRGIGRVRALLRSPEVGGIFMDAQSLIVLIISALTTAYLFYALLRPEQF
jgi:K+-transporting ATPase KdpF subunit